MRFSTPTKEGFLRSETSLIQTIGRAARNADGHVIMYADTVTRSMKAAIDESNRRREKQEAYNKAHGIVPKTVIKEVRDVIDISSKDKKGKKVQTKLSAKDKTELIARLKEEMLEASAKLEFERAAFLRDEIIRVEKQR